MTRPFSVVAIIAARNEADIIEHVVCDLIDQGIDVYYIDDDSSDGTRAIVERHVGRGVRAVEAFRSTSGGYEWERLLRRKEEIAATLDADWFIHHDADEFRESPWLHLSLPRAIQQVDEFGYNAIDFVRYDFGATHDRFRPGDDVRMAFSAWAPPAEYDRLQVRCWKRTAAPVDLATSGGHDVKFPDRRVFPIRFVLRHYPIRGREHGIRKVAERRSRFLASERARGWHVQYDHVGAGGPELADTSRLHPFDPVAIRLEQIVNHRVVDELRATLTDTEQRFRATLADTEQRLRAALADAEQRQAQLAATTSALTQAMESIRALQQRVQDLQRSFSWRITAPARALLRPFIRS